MMWKYNCGTSKLEAIKSKQHPTFESPDSYKDFDFSKEPKQSFYDLLVQEAKTIREKYPKIRLWYSGGCDSSLILDVFTRNNIHLDEIHLAKSGIKEADFEFDAFALPFLNKLKLTNTKIVIHEPTIKDYYKFYENKNWVEDFAKVHPQNFQYHFRLHYINEVNNLYGDNFINIRGKEKPNVMYINGKYYTYFLDGDIEDQPLQINFYIDNPIISSKQSHMLKNAMKLNNNKINAYDRNECTGRYIFSTNFPIKNLHMNNKNGYITHNNTKIHYSNSKEKIALEVMSKEHSKLIELWQNGLQPLYEYKNWFNQNKPECGTVGIFSKFYCLDTKDSKTVDELFPNGFKV